MGLFDRFGKKMKPQRMMSDQPAPPTSVGGDSGSETLRRPVDSGGLERDNGRRARISRGLFGRLRHGLKRTSQLLNTDIRDLFKQEGQLVDDEMLDQLYAAACPYRHGRGAGRRDP